MLHCRRRWDLSILGLSWMTARENGGCFLRFSTSRRTSAIGRLVSLTLLRLDAGNEGLDEFFAASVLLPESDDEEEGLIDAVLAQRIAEQDRFSVLRGLWVDRDASVLLVGRRRNVPLVRRTRRTMSAEECVCHPVLEAQSVLLDLGGMGYCTKKEPQQHEPPPNHGQDNDTDGRKPPPENSGRAGATALLGL